MKAMSELMPLLARYVTDSDTDLDVPEFLRRVADRIYDDLETWESDGSPPREWVENKAD